MTVSVQGPKRRGVVMGGWQVGHAGAVMLPCLSQKVMQSTILRSLCPALRHGQRDGGRDGEMPHVARDRLPHTGSSAAVL